MRIKSIFIVPVLTIIFFCASCGNTKTPKAVDSPISFTDSLEKYQGTDSLIREDHFKLYSGMINGLHFGLVETSDTSSLLFQKTGNAWEITDSIPFPILFIEKTDLNDDNNQDIILTYFVTAAGANSQNVCFLFDPKTKQLVHNELFDLANVAFDKEQHLLISSWWGGANSTQTKASYKVVNDSLIFNAGVIFSAGKKEGIVEYFVYENNSEKIIKRVEGDRSEMWDLFSHEVWDSSDDVKNKK